MPQPVRRSRSRQPRRRIRDRIGRRSRLIAVLLSASLVYVIVDIFVAGTADPARHRAQRLGRRDSPSRRWSRPPWVYDKMGQRSVLVPILLLVAGVFARRHRTWRPVVLAAMSFLVLNVVVGAMKIIIGRSRDRDRQPRRARRRHHLPVRALVQHGAHRWRDRLPAAAVRRRTRRCAVIAALWTVLTAADDRHRALHRQPLADRPGRRRAGRRAAAAVGDPVRHRDGRRPPHPAVVVAEDGGATALPRDGSTRS